MSRATERLATLREQLSDIESKIEAVEDKIRRGNFRKERKKWRKKMATEMYFRILQKLVLNVESQMYGNTRFDTADFLGISQYLGATTSRYSAKDGINT